MARSLYGQYCPIAITLELLGGRWTLLIVRELLEGSTRFNDIHRGVPLMSRSLLSGRLKDLERAKLISRSHAAGSGHVEYVLSDAGRSLLSVIGAVGQWGQEWLEKSTALDEIDGGHLMWNLRKSARWIEEMGPRCVVSIEFTDWDEGRRQRWLVIEETGVDLCYTDPGHEIGIWIETNLRTMVEVWMGWTPLAEAEHQGRFQIEGDPCLARDPLRWLGQSPIAGVAQRPSDQKVGLMLEKLTP